MSDSTYRRQWQVKTASSMIKRNLGCCLYDKTQQSQNCEMCPLVITHNILIILFLFFKKLFYKAETGILIYPAKAMLLKDFILHKVHYFCFFCDEVIEAEVM